MRPWPPKATPLTLACLVILFVVVTLTAPSASRHALLNSAILGVGAVALALPLGTLLAVVLARFDIPGRQIAATAIGGLIFLPLYVQLSAWDAALGKLGWFTLSHGSLVEPFLSGMRGAIFVHGLAAVPWVALLVGIGLLQVDSASEESALLIVSPTRVLWHITLPQILPFLAAAAIWTLVTTTSEMTVTNIYLINPSQWTYTERFYMRMASGDVQTAAVAVLPAVCGLALTIAGALIVASRLMNRRRLPTHIRPVTFSPGSWKWPATITVWLVVLLLLGVPIISLISKAGFVVTHDGATRIRSWSATGCLREVATVPVKFRAELLGTIEVATLAATAALAVSAPLAWRARRGGWAATPAISLSSFALALPGPLIGAALIHFLNHDLPPQLPLADGTSKSWLLILYDQTPLAPAFAQAIRALPLTIMLLWHSSATLDDDVLSAAALDGLPPSLIFWKIAVPQRWRAIVAAWIAAFAVAAGDLAWAHLVTPPGLDLLSRRVFGLVHSGVEEQVAAISLVNIAAYAILATTVFALLRSQRANPSR